MPKAKPLPKTAADVEAELHAICIRLEAIEPEREQLYARRAALLVHGKDGLKEPMTNQQLAKAAGVSTTAVINARRAAAEPATKVAKKATRARKAS